MKNTEAIKENYIFRALYRRGRQCACKSMAVYVNKSRQKTVNRLGFTVSTKLGCAVVRNRIRRRLREAYRLLEPQLNVGYDIVIAARAGCENVPFDTLVKDIKDIFGRLGVLK